MIGPQRSMLQISALSSSASFLCGRRGLFGLARWLGRGDRSAVAVELGIIAIPFFMMFLGVMEISYDLFVQAALNNAVEAAARGVQVGYAKDKSGEKSSKFVADAVCPNLGGLLDCDLLTVGVVPILPVNTDYFDYFTNQPQLTEDDATIGKGVCSGVGGEMMLLQAWYDGPTFVGLLIPSFTTARHGSIVHITIAQAGFVNEYFAGGQNC